MLTAPKCRPSGPLDARIVIVGEAPGKDEDGRTPFLGAAGDELNKMLFEAKLDREECFLTNVTPYRPPRNKIEAFFLDGKTGKKPGPEITEGLAELMDQLDQVKPNLVIAFGNTALWALRGHRKITSWRGSELQAHTRSGHPYVLVPTYHPAAILRMWAWRSITVADLARAAKYRHTNVVTKPAWNFRIRPTFDEVMSDLEKLRMRAGCGSEVPLYLAVDIETHVGHTACIGLAWDRLNALCIPFIDYGKLDGYWTEAQEYQIILLLKELLTHPYVRLIGQNFLYDNSYNGKHWGFAPIPWMDTMVAQHVCWPGLPKKLDFLSSMYCDFHEYWKDDGKEFGHWKTADQWAKGFEYNCVDNVRTFEVAEALDRVIDMLGRRPQYEFQMRRLYQVCQRMMFRGVHIDLPLRNKMAMEVLDQMNARQAMIDYFAERPINIDSPKQLRELFYDDFQMKPVYNLKSKVREDGTRTPTVDEDALEVFWKRERLLKPLCGAVTEHRTLGNAMNVIRSPIDADGRMRSSVNIARVETFRFSSSKSPFGGGTNMQNLTTGSKSEYTGLFLPNMRCLIKPAPDHIICEGDLDRADLQVVVWEAGDDGLKFALKTGLDLHLFNARVIFQLPYTIEDLRDPEKVKHLAKLYHPQRQVAKVFCHATNYLGQAKTVAQHCGLLVRETERMQAVWFYEHPGIKQWHNRVALELAETRSVKNRFGCVRFYFDRIEECLSEAVAWVPQSTVALVINTIIVNLYDAFDNVKPNRLQILLQTHDSVTFQYHESEHPKIIRDVEPYTKVSVPYADPLIIPLSFKASRQSWGDVRSDFPGLTAEIPRGIIHHYPREQLGHTQASPH